MAHTEEPIICKLDRLDHVLRQLEEIRGGGGGTGTGTDTGRSSKSSSGTLTSDGQASSVDFSPLSLDKHHCRPLADVKMEAEVKGSLMERLARVELRLRRVEEQLEEEKRRREEAAARRKGGLKQFVKSCVGGSPKAH